MRGPRFIGTSAGRVAMPMPKPGWHWRGAVGLFMLAIPLGAWAGMADSPSRTGSVLLALALLVLAALDGDPDRLASVAGTARTAGDVEIEVLALDALAHVRAVRGDADGAREALAGADAAMPGARHLLADGDRVDRDLTLSHV